MSANRTIQVSPADRSLFHIAAAYLGDATQAWRIAALNGLTDFWIGEEMSLRIPAEDSSYTTGLPE